MERVFPVRDAMIMVYSDVRVVRATLLQSGSAGDSVCLTGYYTRDAGHWYVKGVAWLWH